MNVDIIEPFNRLHLAGNVKISALKFAHDRLFLGFSNGDLTIMRASAQILPNKSAPTSVRSFRSFSDIKRLFSDNDQSQLLVIEKTFKNVTTNQSAITDLDSLPLYKENNREVILVGNDEVLLVYEWVGSHLNMINTFGEARNYSKFNYMECGDVRLILIGVRKKLLIFKVVQKTRNVIDFNLYKEVALKERIRTITCYPENCSALLGLDHSFLILDGKTFEVRELLTNESSIYSLMQSTSFSYFGFSNVGPEVKIIPCDGEYSLVIRDSQVGLLQFDENHAMLHESNIKLPAIPVDVAYLYPCYVLFLYHKKLEVVDIESGGVIQEFYHLFNNNGIYLSVEDNIIMIGSGGYVFQFNLLPYQKQLDQFLSIRGAEHLHKSGKDPSNDLRLLGIDRALGLLVNLHESDDFFTDHSDTAMSNKKMKQLLLRDLYKNKALVFFESYSKYHEALVDIASEWVISCKDILPLFPDFLNADFMLNNDLETAPTKSRSAIRKVSIEEVYSVLKQDETEYISGSGSKTEEKPSGKNDSKPPNLDPKVLQRVKKFTKAVNNLIVYLTDQRRIHLSFISSSEEIPSIAWKDGHLNVLDIYPGISKSDLKNELQKLCTIIDTSLFLCYFYTKPMLLGPLLRLPNNRCDAKIVNDCLLSHLHNHTQELQNFMRELLDFYFGRGLHKDALNMLKNLAQESESKHDEFDEYLRGPALMIIYLQKLTNDDIGLIFEFSAWILTLDTSMQLERACLIFMNESYECESYDNFKVSDFLTKILDKLGIKYLEWLLFESDVLESGNRRANVEKFETKLCLLYLKELKALHVPDDALLKSPTYIKLHRLLETTTSYDPWTVLREIPTSEDSYLRLTIFVYKKLGEHQKSVDILFNQLSDLNGAMLYCSDVYQQPNMKETGTSLLHKLLEDLVMHYEENQDYVATLLKLQGKKMSILQVLTVLPDSFPLHKLLLYLEEQIRTSENDLDSTRIASQLYKIGSAKVHHNLLVAQSDFHAFNSGNERCNICGEKLGYSVLSVDKRNRVVHYGCQVKANA